MVFAMFDPFTLDQLRAFVAVVEEGSFSAAARKLHRVQSAVSTAMANLENQLGLPLWDRTTKIAQLTEAGQAVLAATRRVLLEADALQRLAAGMVSGVEATVSLCVDALFPVSALTDLCARFAKEFPTVDLRVDTQIMSAVSARVLSGDASLGVVSHPGLATGLERIPLAQVLMISVTGPNHPLASLQGLIPDTRLAAAVQIVLSERLASKTEADGEENGRGRARKNKEVREVGVIDQAVLSPRTWRVADLHTKHAMLRANLGWGNLPEHLAASDLRKGKLVRIHPAAWPEGELSVRLWAIYRSDTTFGPAHRWLIACLEQLCVASA